jgi:hypothetical protein
MVEFGGKVDQPISYMNALRVTKSMETQITFNGENEAHVVRQYHVVEPVGKNAGAEGDIYVSGSLFYMQWSDTNHIRLNKCPGPPRLE